MTAKRKSQLYRVLKDQGRVEKHYREYTVAELEDLLGAEAPPAVQEPKPQPTPVQQQVSRPASPAPVTAGPNPEEMPAQRLNTKADDEVIRVDEQGRQWLQEEVRKPAYPKPRGRRVLTYFETGVEQQTVQNGEYVETFEVAGNRQGRAAEVKITLPSYQVGIYKDPRFPFKVHTYNGREAFDLFDVNNYYGGPELVPTTVKRVYIENKLCYDMRSVIAAIQAEHRALQLAGRIK